MLRASPRSALASMILAALVVTACNGSSPATSPATTASGTSATSAPPASADPAVTATASGQRPDEGGPPQPVMVPVLAKICADAPCAGPMSRIDVYRDKFGKVALYEHNGDLSRCSHAPTVFYDAAGAEKGTIANKAVAAGSDEDKRYREMRAKIIGDAKISETLGCDQKK